VIRMLTAAARIIQSGTDHNLNCFLADRRNSGEGLPWAWSAAPIRDFGGVPRTGFAGYDNGVGNPVCRTPSGFRLQQWLNNIGGRYGVAYR
jgi:hypothetical protein